ncbi:hypothetical protein [Paenibacillus sp.]
MIVERRLVRSIARKASYVWHATMNKRFMPDSRPLVIIICNNLPNCIGSDSES